MDTTNTNMELARAVEHAEIAEREYTEYVNLILRTGDDWDFRVLEDLRDRANAADARVLAARDSLWHGPYREDTEVVMVEDGDIPYGYRVPRGQP